MAEQTEFDVIVIGAGAAGLAALEELDRAGCRVLCLEARDRIGGRVLTLRDSLSPIPIELGAEFIHGRPPELWNLIRTKIFSAYDCDESSVHIQAGKVTHNADAWQLGDRIMQEMRKAAQSGPDRTFAAFLDSLDQPPDAKRVAKLFIEGFNAAHASVVGIASLAADAATNDEIDGECTFRIANGYDALLLHLIGGVERLPDKLNLNSVVELVEWSPGRASIRSRSALTGSIERYVCRAVLISVSLGVLQAEPGSPGAIEFSPEPREPRRAIRALKFGDVIRVVLRFRDAFWERNPEFKDAGFLLSDERYFPVWWTALPIRSPLITGWSAGPHADGLLEQPRPDLVLTALADLARITGVAPDQLTKDLEAFYFHDWHNDPFSRGAYSYVPVGALAAREQLAHPVSNTLFFAGEAAEAKGHSATVHGAIASGRRAVKQILDRI